MKTLSSPRSAAVTDPVANPEDTLPDDWSRQVVMMAWPSRPNEVANPTWASLRVTPSFLKRLRKLHGLVVSNDVNEVRVTASPDAWDLDAITSGSLMETSLVVDGYAMYFVAKVDSENVEVETIDVAITWLYNRLLATPDGDIVLVATEDADATKLVDAWTTRCNA